MVRARKITQSGNNEELQGTTLLNFAQSITTLGDVLRDVNTTLGSS